VEWLLASPEPAIRHLTRRDLLGERSLDDPEHVLDGPVVRALFAGQKPDGGFGGQPYNKWGGAHWRLVTLVELGVPPGEPRAVAAAETVLAWLTGSHVRNVPIINGLARRCASQEGNALAVASRLGLADDQRVQQLAESLIRWQWPDGGWNCDRRPSAHHSSFNESLTTMWGLHEFAVATGDAAAASAARRTAELLLDHRIFRSERTGEPIHPSVVIIHWPPYWHYDLLHALLVLSRMGLAADPRSDDAVETLREQRGADGRWRPGKRWWSVPTAKTGNRDVVNWARKEVDQQMATLNALRVLKARGELELDGGHRVGG
jgi:hypothetical protein